MAKEFNNASGLYELGKFVRAEKDIVSEDEGWWRDQSPQVLVVHEYSRIDVEPQRLLRVESPIG